MDKAHCYLLTIVHIDFLSVVAFTARGFTDPLVFICSLLEHVMIEYSLVFGDPVQLDG